MLNIVQCCLVATEGNHRCVLRSNLAARWSINQVPAPVARARVTTFNLVPLGEIYEILSPPRADLPNALLQWLPSVLLDQNGECPTLQVVTAST